MLRKLSCNLTWPAIYAWWFPVSLRWRQLDRFQNPNMERILQVAGSFDPTWRRELESLEDRVKDAVDSIVSNRNQISHGENVGLSLGTMRRYYDGAVVIVEAIQKQCELS